MEPDRRTDVRPDDEAGMHAVERALDDEVARMQRESDRVERDIDETRRTWEALREDPAAPGARPREDSPPPPDDPLERAAGDWAGTAEAADEAGQD